MVHVGHRPAVVAPAVRRAFSGSYRLFPPGLRHGANACRPLAGAVNIEAGKTNDVTHLAGKVYPPRGRRINIVAAPLLL